MNASIESLNPVATVTLQKKIYFDVNDPTNVSMTEGSFAVVNIALDSKSESDTKILISLNDPQGRFENVDSFLIIPAGSISKPIVLQTINDSIYQGPTEISLIATKEDASAESEQARLIIKLIDDEAKPNISIAANSANENAGSISFTVSSNRQSALDIEFYYNTTDMTALAGSDYTAVALTKAIIPAGQSSVVVSVSIIDDAIFENNEKFLVNLTNATNADLQVGSVEATIINDDTMPVVNFATTSSTQNENAGSISVQVSLDITSNVDVSIPYVLSGTAVSGSDYTISLASPIVIPAGTLSKSFNITIADDSLSEFTETAVITLASPTAASIGVNSSYTLTINDNDMVTASFSLASQSVNENSGTWADWHSSLSNWSRRRLIEIVGLSSSVTNFPILVKLDSSRIDYSQTQGAGQDLRFIDSSGSNIPYEIESWDSAGTSYVWIKVPLIPAAPGRSQVWMYYGNVSASAGQNKVDVWDSSFQGVWHLNGNASDATVNVKDGSTTGVGYSSGSIGQAASFNGVTGNSITLPNAMTTSNILTVSLIFKTTGTGVLFSHSNVAYSTAPALWDPLLYVDTSGKLRGGNYASGLPAYVSTQQVNDNQWHQAVWVGNTNSQSLYLDGLLVGTYSNTLAMASIIYNYIGMGYWSSWPSSGSGWNTINGSIDEVSISNVARDGNWVSYNYASYNDNLLFFSSEEVYSASGLATILVQLDSNAVNNVTVPYTVSGTAISGTDHNLISGSLVIPTGSNSGSIPVRYFKDTLAESDETVIVTMGSLINAVPGSITQHTITLNNEVNINPVANDDNFIVAANSQQVFDVLNNDTDANIDVITLTSTSAASHGTVSILGKKIVYTPSSVFGAMDAFTYTISDGRGGSATGTVNISFQVPYTWTGAGSNSLWSNGSNWIGGVAPGSGNVVYFNNQCSTNCNPTFNAAVTVAGARIHSSYTGTINQSSGYTITVGSSGWIQYAGSFNGSDANVTINGSFNLYSGNFKNSSALNIFGASFNDTGVGTFDGTVGTTRFQGGYSTSPSLIISNRTFNSVAFYGTSNIYTLSGSMTVNSLLNLRNSDYGCGINGGTINLKGNLTIDSNPNDTSSGCSGNALIILSSNSDQTITGNAYYGRTPKIEIASTGGTVYLQNKISIWNGFKHTSGVVDTAGSDIKLNASYNSACAFDFNTTAFNHLHITGSNSTISMTGTANVAGDLHITNRGYDVGRLNGGQINVSGNLFSDGTATGIDLGMTGDALIRLVGSAPQNIYGFSGSYYGTLPKVTIASSSTVAINNRVKFSNSFSLVSSAGVITTDSQVYFNAYYLNSYHTVAGISFNNVAIGGSGSGVNDFSGNALDVSGNLNIIEGYGCYINNVTINVYGNISTTGQNGGCLGNASINFVGNTNATISMTTTNANYFFPSGAVTVNKPGASLTLLSRFNPNSTGQSLNLAAGSINLSGNLLYTKGLSLNGNTIYLSGGTLYVNGVSVSDGSSYGGVISP